jgi:CdiI immunity protein
MMHEGENKSGKKVFDKADYPALMEFLPAYLHQDFGEEYGSVVEAVKAFLGDASGDQILEVQEEWRKLREALAGRSLGEWQAALRQLGSAWEPQTEQEVRTVSEILSQAEA